MPEREADPDSCTPVRSTQAHTGAHTGMHAHTNTGRHTAMHTHSYAHTDTRTRACTHRQTYMLTQAHTQAHTGTRHTHIYTQTQAHVHAHTRMHTHVCPPVHRASSTLVQAVGSCLQSVCERATEESQGVVFQGPFSQVRRAYFSKQANFYENLRKVCS